MIESTQGKRRARKLRALGTWGAVGCLLGATGAWATVPCEKAENALHAAPAPQRLATAVDILKSRCQPLLPEILTAMKTRQWSDRTSIPNEDRVTLLNTGVAQGYEEAIAASVSVLETGMWPGNEPLDMVSGAKVAEGLGMALDPYRILLLLDVYEQIDLPAVRSAVIRALRHGTGAEALLPALDAYWTGKGETQVLAAEVIAAQPEKKADAVLTRVAAELPKGPALVWAERLATAHGVEAAVRAAKRG